MNISPIRSDLDVDRIAQRPGSNVAVLLAIAHELLENGWHDQGFLDRYTVGFDQLAVI